MKSIKFKKSWSDAIAQFPPEVRCEIYAATLFYSLENRVPAGMSDLARGAFAFLKMEIDAARLRASRRLGQAGGQTGDTPENTRAEPLEADDNPDSNAPTAEPVAAPEATAPRPRTKRHRPGIRRTEPLRKPSTAPRTPRKKPLAEAVRKRIYTARRIIHTGHKKIRPR